MDFGAARALHRTWGPTVYAGIQELGGGSLAVIRIVFLIVHRRIGEAENPGPPEGTGGHLSTYLDSINEADLTSLIRASRNSLAVALSGARAMPCSERPVFKEQLGDATASRAPRRAPIQTPLGLRMGTAPVHPIPLDRGRSRAAQASDAATPPVATAPTPIGRTPRPRGGRAARGCRAGARVRRGRGQHHSAAAARDGFSIYLANVSSWNEVVSDYVFNLDSDAVLFA